MLRAGMQVTRTTNREINRLRHENYEMKEKEIPLKEDLIDELKLEIRRLNNKLFRAELEMKK